MYLLIIKTTSECHLPHDVNEEVGLDEGDEDLAVAWRGSTRLSPAAVKQSSTETQ